MSTALAETPVPEEALHPQCLFLALPRRPGATPPADEKPGTVSMIRPVSRGLLGAARMESSLLCPCFNRLWCVALNHREKDGLTHFAMQHDDIRPAVGWADVLIDEMERTGADVVSAVVPLKDDRGLTSTALRNATTGKARRLSMTEVFALPETFDLADLKAAGLGTGREPDSDLLAINTGLWVCRIDADWVERFPGFAMSDTVRRRADGAWEAAGISEDWQFSEWLWRQGLKAVATRKVPLAHIGLEREYRNDSVWGAWATDQGDIRE